MSLRAHFRTVRKFRYEFDISNVDYDSTESRKSHLDRFKKMFLNVLLRLMRILISQSYPSLGNLKCVSYFSGAYFIRGQKGRQRYEAFDQPQLAHLTERALNFLLRLVQFCSDQIENTEQVLVCCCPKTCVGTDKFQSSIKLKQYIVD